MCERRILCLCGGRRGRDVYEKTKKPLLYFGKKDDFVQGVSVQLMLCSAVVKRAGGKLEMNSHDGKGLTLSIWLPCKFVCI